MPFQRSTRDRIATAIPPLALRIRQDRLQLARLAAYTNILRQDLDREEKEWSRLRHVALQAAARSLLNPKGVRAVVEDVNANEEPGIPILSLPSPGAIEDEQTRLGSSPGELPIVFRRPSDDVLRPTMARHASANSHVSLSESLRPTLRRCSSDVISATGSPDRSTESPQKKEDANWQSSSADERSPPSFFALSDADDEIVRHATIKARKVQPESVAVERDERAVNGEEAEDWQKTRAARRVSLASVPHSHMRELSQLKSGRSEGQGDVRDGGREGKEVTS